MYHINANKDTFYLPRKDGERNIIQPELSYKTTTTGHLTYILQSHIARIINLENEHENSFK